MSVAVSERSPSGVVAFDMVPPARMVHELTHAQLQTANFKLRPPQTSDLRTLEPSNLGTFEPWNLGTLPRPAQPAFHGGVADDAGVLVDDETALEDEEVRDALDAVLAGELRMPVRVDLEDERAAGHGRGHTRDLRCRGAAGAAPRRPEIHEHGHGRVSPDVLEQFHVGGDGFRDRTDGRLALAAARRRREVRGADAVLLTTGWTGTNHG